MPRNCSCFTAPSVRPSSCAISRMLFSSAKRIRTTFRCSRGNSWTRRNNCARISISSGLGSALAEIICKRVGLLARAAPPAIRDGVRRDAHQPRAKGSATPFEARQIRKRVVKHLGRHVFSRFAVRQAPRDVRVHALEVNFIERAEAARVLLRRFDQPPFAGFLYGLQRELRSSCCHSIELPSGGKVTVRISCRVRLASLPSRFESVPLPCRFLPERCGCPSRGRQGRD